MIIILMGKTAVGKDTVFKHILKDFANIKPVISDTTRPPRAGEVDGRDYNFITLEEYQKRTYIEQRVYNTTVEGKPVTYYYGCPELDPDSEYIGIFDTYGAKEIIDILGKESCFCVYLTNTEEICRERAFERGSITEEEWQRRLDDDNTRFTKENVDAIANDTFVTDMPAEDTARKIMYVYEKYKQSINSANNGGI